MTLLERLKFILDNDFKRVSYTEAIDILKNSKPNKKKKFKYLIDSWGADFNPNMSGFWLKNTSKAQSFCMIIQKKSRHFNL